jgi:hypothetical protein
MQGAGDIKTSFSIGRGLEFDATSNRVLLVMPLFVGRSGDYHSSWNPILRGRPRASLHRKIRNFRPGDSFVKRVETFIHVYILLYT